MYQNLPILYKSPLKIKLRKFEELQSLKTVIYEDYRHFYDALPHECDDPVKELGKCKHVQQVGHYLKE